MTDPPEGNQPRRALEDPGDILADRNHLAVVSQLEDEIARLSRKLVLSVPLEVAMAADLLTASEAARRLGIPTRELLRLVHERKIRFVMVKGIAHVPDDAVEEYQDKAS